MKTLLFRLSAVVLSLGMLGAAACSGCSETPEDTSATSAVSQPMSYQCGAGTVRQGNQCVRAASTGTTSNSSSRPTTLNTSGNN